MMASVRCPGNKLLSLEIIERDSYPALSSRAAKRSTMTSRGVHFAVMISRKLLKISQDLSET